MKLILLFAMSALWAASAQELNNASILKLVQSGLGEDLIVSMIRTQPGKYSTTANDIVTLKTAGVSDKVLSAILERAAGPAAAQPVPAAAPPPAAPVVNPAAANTDVQPKEIGVYSRKASAWVELDPEIVNWKTGGTLKSMATYGMVKKDVNGHLNGPHSRNSLTTPIEVLIYAPEGVSAAEYQLLRLRENKSYREFRTMTGGIFNSKGGASRDTVEFEAKKVASRTYVISLAGIKPGEYGLIHLGSAGASGGMSSLSMGKMYTFRVLE